MNCDQAHELFSDYITGDLDSALRVKVESHLAESESCRVALEEVRLLWSDLDQLPAVEPPAAFHSELMARLSTEMDVVPAPPQRRQASSLRSLLRPSTLALAATLLLCALAGIEVVQTQRASLGPFGMLARLLHPTVVVPPHLQGATAEWTSLSGTSGTLVVRLKTDPSSDPHSNGAFTVTLKRKSPGGPDAILATSQVSLGGDETRTVALKLNEAPTAATSTLEVSSAPGEGQPAQSLSVPLPTN